MTVMKRRTPFSMPAVLVLVALALAATIPLLARTRAAAVREVSVVVRGMSFYADGLADPNPTLRVKRGERLRFVVRNEDSGMAHDLSIRAWDVGTKVLKGRERDVVEFRAPEAAGEAVYACTPHSAMMRGTIIVE